ncbi:hypothetical protein [Sporosarcina jiandibaonis]|uniref:DUF7210 family protein n=1 Tax=Sporosarcina jiandibaonis TaxID=2715535 RepID=UPI001C1305BD|nr:hypothetical protein [Sporosarcina jiandibaonis]
MEVKAKANIKYNGKWHKTGDDFIVNREVGDGLIERGLAVETEKSKQETKEAKAAKEKAEAEKAAEAEKQAAEKAKADAAAKKKAEEEAAKKGK